MALCRAKVNLLRLTALKRCITSRLAIATKQASSSVDAELDCSARSRSSSMQTSSTAFCWPSTGPR